VINLQPTGIIGCASVAPQKVGIVCREAILIHSCCTVIHCSHTRHRKTCCGCGQFSSLCFKSL